MPQGQADRCYAQEWSAEEQRTLELGLVKWPQVLIWRTTCHLSTGRTGCSGAAPSVHSQSFMLEGPHGASCLLSGTHAGPGAVSADRGHAAHEGRPRCGAACAVDAALCTAEAAGELHNHHDMRSAISVPQISAAFWLATAATGHVPALQVSAVYQDPDTNRAPQRQRQGHTGSIFAQAQPAPAAGPAPANGVPQPSASLPVVNPYQIPANMLVMPSMMPDGEDRRTMSDNVRFGRSATVPMVSAPAPLIKDLDPGRVLWLSIAI